MTGGARCHGYCCVDPTELTEPPRREVVSGELRYVSQCLAEPSCGRCGSVFCRVPRGLRQEAMGRVRLRSARVLASRLPALARALECNRVGSHTETGLRQTGSAGMTGLRSSGFDATRGPRRRASVGAMGRLRLGSLGLGLRQARSAGMTGLRWPESDGMMGRRGSETAGADARVSGFAAARLQRRRVDAACGANPLPLGAATRSRVGRGAVSEGEHLSPRAGAAGGRRRTRLHS